MQTPPLFEKDLVSIGMPTYDKGLPYLRRAIDSALAQTYKNIELVITDNSPTEATRALCDEYARKDKRVRYIPNEKDVGTCENYNYALQRSRGEYFCWVAFDDSIHSRFVEKCVAVLEKDAEAVMVMSNFAFTDSEKGVPVGETMEPEEFMVFDRDLYTRLKKYILMYWGEGKATIIHGLWRREAIADDRILEWDADVNFIFHGLVRGPFLFVNEVLFYKGILPGGLSREHEPLTLGRLLSSTRMRLSLAHMHWMNVKYIAGIRGLSVVARLKLMLWEGVATLRLFLRRRY